MFPRFSISIFSLIGYRHYWFRFMIYLLSGFSTIRNRNFGSWKPELLFLVNNFVCFPDSRFSIFRISKTGYNTYFSTECLFLNLWFLISQIIIFLPSRRSFTPHKNVIRKYNFSIAQSSLSSFSWIRMMLLPFFLSEIYILLQCHYWNQMIKIVNWSGLLIYRITMTLLRIMLYVIFTFFYDVIVELEWYKLVHWSGFCNWHALLQRTDYILIIMKFVKIISNQKDDCHS